MVKTDERLTVYDVIDEEEAFRTVGGDEGRNHKAYVCSSFSVRNVSWHSMTDTTANHALKFG